MPGTEALLASRWLPASPSDTLHPINEVSPLIFRTLICAAPEAALIQTECDNFNDETKQRTNKPKDLLLNRGGVVCGETAFEVGGKQAKEAFYVAAPSLRRAR